jgi:superfamily I DNA and RNA helicase
MSLCRIGRVTEFTTIMFASREDNGCFKPKESTMPEAVPQQTWPHRFDESDRDIQLKQVLDSLQNENSQLKNLVVRLSETIIRNVTAKR